MTYEHMSELYDLLYGAKDYVAEADRLRALLEEHAERPIRTLLDVACGTALHLEQLARYYAVEGTDLSPEMLAVARGRLPDVPFHVADLRSFDLGRQFDTVICLFGSIGYSLTTEALRSAVSSMARHLSPGGVLLLEPFLTPDSFRADVPNAVFVDRPDLKVVRMSVPRVDGSCGILDFHYLVADPSGVRHFTERHELGLFTDADYRGAIVAAGLDLRQDDRTLTGRGLFIGLRV